MNKLGYNQKTECRAATKSHAVMPLAMKGVPNHLSLQNVFSLFYELKPVSTE